MIAVCRPRTQAYAARRTKEGKTKREIIRCLKRYIAREAYHALQADLADLGALQPPPPHHAIAITCGAGFIGRHHRPLDIHRNVRGNSIRQFVRQLGPPVASQASAVECGPGRATNLVPSGAERPEPPYEHRFWERPKVVEGRDRRRRQSLRCPQREFAGHSAHAPRDGSNENPLHDFVGGVPTHD
jgi:hypothetical protein